MKKFYDTEIRVTLSGSGMLVKRDIMMSKKYKTLRVI